MIMKTRVFAFAVMAIMAALITTGCAGKRYADLMVDGKVAITHNDSNISLLQPSIGPVEMARAYEIKKDADAKQALFEDLRKSQSADVATKKAYNYIFALVNNDPLQGIYVDHPEMPDVKVVAEPGGKPELIFLWDIPHKILYRRSSDGKIFKEYSPRYDSEFAEKISHKKKINGVWVDFVLRVNQAS